VINFFFFFFGEHTGVSSRNETFSLLRNVFENLMAVYQVYGSEFIETEVCR